MPEYNRLGQVLATTKSLDDIVEKVDLQLSANNEYAVLKVERAEDKGPEGQDQYFANRTMKQSWWIPTTMKLSAVIHRRPEDKAPFVFDEKNKRSYFCLNLQRELAEHAANGFASSTGDIPLPKPVATACAPSAPTIGSAPIPGLKKDANSTSAELLPFLFLHFVCLQD